MRNNEWNPENISDQSGTVVVVTGSSSGIGYETARVLANKHAEVIIAVRNLEKGHAAAQKIASQYQKANVKVMRLDLADLSSVKHFAEECLSTYSRLDRLINNAGVMLPPYSKTVDGFELQFGTNHLGHFALTARLMSLAERDEKFTRCQRCEWRGEVRPAEFRRSRLGEAAIQGMERVRRQ